ncbi:hypothetical protein NMG60_11007956 [Bertholletia excelsa]
MENPSHTVSKKAYNGNGYGAKNVYDDVFGGPPKFGVPTLSPRVEDYNEIFGSFHATRASSIPVLDLPAAEEGDFSFDVRSDNFDYSEVFGGFNSLDFAVSFEELFAESKTTYDSSDEAWTPAHSESFSDESEPCSERTQSLSNGEPCQSHDRTKRFDILCNEGGQKSKEEDRSDGVARVAELGAIPGFHAIVDETIHLQKMGDRNRPSQGTDKLNKNVEFHRELREGKQFRKTLSHPSNSSFGMQALGTNINPVGYGRTAPYMNEAFVTISDISLRTQPSQLPPPMRPPPDLSVKKGDSDRQKSMLKASKSFAFGEMADDSFPPFFDVEVDASSSAAVSAAAIKDAMDKAHAKLKSAKELKERKKDCLNHTKLGSKNDAKYEAKANCMFDGSDYFKEEKVHETCKDEFSGMKTFSGEQGQNVRNATQVILDSVEGETYKKLPKISADRKHGKEHRSSEKSSKTEGAISWTEGEQFYELVETDKSRNVLDKGNNDSILVKNIEFHEQRQEKQGEVLVERTRETSSFEQQQEESWKVNADRESHKCDGSKGRVKATKLKSRQEEHEKEVNVTQEASKQEEIGKKSRMSQLHGNVENRPTEANKLEEHESLLQKRNEVQVKHKLKEASRGKEDEKIHKDAHESSIKETFERERYEKRLKGSIERAEIEKRAKEALYNEEKAKLKREACEREEKRKKEASEREEKEKRQKEAYEKEEQEKRQKVAQQREESEKRLKEAHEREEAEKRLKEARQREENEKRLKEARQREENEKRLKEAHQREENEKRLKEAHEREEAEKRQKEALEREEAEKRRKEACEREEAEAKQKEALEREEIEKRLKEACEREETEKKLKEAREREENEKKLKKAQEAEEDKKRLKEAWEEEEIKKRQELPLDQEETVIKHNPALKRDESKSRLVGHLILEQLENKSRGALLGEGNAEKQKLAHEVEGSEESLNEFCEMKENVKRLKETWEQKNKNVLRDAHKMKESEKISKDACNQKEDKRSEKANECDDTQERFGNVNYREELKKQCKDLDQNESNGNERKVMHTGTQKFWASERRYEVDHNKSQKSAPLASKQDTSTANMKKIEGIFAPENDRINMAEPLGTKGKVEAGEMVNVMLEEQFNSSGTAQIDLLDKKNEIRSTDSTESLHETVNQSAEAGIGIKQMHMDPNKKTSKISLNPGRPNIPAGEVGETSGKVKEAQVKFDEADDKNKFVSVQAVMESLENERKVGADHPGIMEGKRNAQGTFQKACTTLNTEGKEKNVKSILTREEREKEERIKRERELEKDRLRKIEEEMEREREREKDRMAVDRATLEARERAFAEARERSGRAAVERATAEVRQRAMAEARERLEKASVEARERSYAEKEAKLRAERAAVERATVEARERAFQKVMAEKASFEARERVDRSVSDKSSASYMNGGMRQNSSLSDLQDMQSQGVGSSNGSIHSYSSVHGGVEGESAQRCKARLERYRRTAERAAKALAEKNQRDLLAQREQAERNRLAESLDAEVKRWSSGKEGNLRALLSTLQYILGSDSGWQPIPLTEVITSAAVKRAYRKATLCVHPDKLQQRGASIQQKYICEKVFDLLKEAWNKFNSEER